MFFSLQYPTNAEYILSALAFFQGKISMKYSSGTPLSTQQQQIVSSSMVDTSVH